MPNATFLHRSRLGRAMTAPGPYPAAPPPSTTPAYGTPPVRPTRRPTGVTVLGVLAIISAFFSAMFGILAFVLGSVLGAIIGGSFAGDGGAAAGGVIGALFGVFFLALGLVALIAGIGLLTGKRWGWYAAFVWAALSVLQGLASLLGLEVVSAAFGIGIGAFVAWYLLSPPVQAWFGVSHTTPWKYNAA